MSLSAFYQYHLYSHHLYDVGVQMQAVAQSLGVKGGRVPPLTARNFSQNLEKEGGNQEKVGKWGKLGKRGNSRRFFHFAPPDR